MTTNKGGRNWLPPRKDNLMYWKGLSKTKEKRLSQSDITPLSQTNIQTLSETNKMGLQALQGIFDSIMKQSKIS